MDASPRQLLAVTHGRRLHSGNGTVTHGKRLHSINGSGMGTDATALHLNCYRARCNVSVLLVLRAYM